MNLDTPAAKFGYGTIPEDRRGVIKGDLPPKAKRTGGDITNAAYAKEHGITQRQASKQRRGY